MIFNIHVWLLRWYARKNNYCININPSLTVVWYHWCTAFEYLLMFFRHSSIIDLKIQTSPLQVSPDVPLFRKPSFINRLGTAQKSCSWPLISQGPHQKGSSYGQMLGPIFAILLKLFRCGAHNWTYLKICGSGFEQILNMFSRYVHIISHPFVELTGTQNSEMPGPSKPCNFLHLFYAFPFI